MMMISSLIFALFASVIVAAALLVIFSRNPVHSVLWLIVAFFNGAGLMLLLGAEFISMLLVIVYVGAVAVLFLFVVMMLNIDVEATKSGFSRHGLVGGAVAALLAVELGLGLYNAHTPLQVAAAPSGLSNIQALGAELYSHYLYVFEAVGMLLLVALIGAIVLTHRARAGVRPQNVGRQVRRRAKDAVILTKPETGKGVEL
jgi:NADH-quinone oxidoreductase subunit J